MDADDQRSSVDPSEQRGGSDAGRAGGRREGAVGGEGRRGRGSGRAGRIRRASARCSTTIPSWAARCSARPPAPTSRPPRTASIPAGGDDADATSDGGPERPAGAEPDLRDAASRPAPGRPRVGRLAGISAEPSAGPQRPESRCTRVSWPPWPTPSDRGPGGRRDRAGAARPGCPRARSRSAADRPRAAALRPVARASPRHRQPGGDRGRGRDARDRPRAEGGDDHAGGRRRRRLAEPDPARAGRRQGDRPHRPPASRAWRRSRACTIRSRWSGWRSRTPTAPRNRARATPGSAVGGRLPDRADHALDLPGRRRVRVPHRPEVRTRACTAARSGRSRRCTRACSRRRWTPPPRGTPRSPTSRS